VRRDATLPPSCADCLEIWEPEAPGTPWACPRLYWDWFFKSKPCAYWLVSLVQFIALLGDALPNVELLVRQSTACLTADTGLLLLFSASSLTFESVKSIINVSLRYAMEQTLGPCRF
jgi:hypothetical protein